MNQKSYICEECRRELSSCHGFGAPLPPISEDYLKCASFIHDSPCQDKKSTHTCFVSGKLLPNFRNSGRIKDLTF